MPQPSDLNCFCLKKHIYYYWEKLYLNSCFSSLYKSFILSYFKVFYCFLFCFNYKHSFFIVPRRTDLSFVLYKFLGQRNSHSNIIFIYNKIQKYKNYNDLSARECFQSLWCTDNEMDRNASSLILPRKGRVIVWWVGWHGGLWNSFCFLSYCISGCKYLSADYFMSHLCARHLTIFNQNEMKLHQVFISSTKIFWVIF